MAGPQPGGLNTAEAALLPGWWETGEWLAGSGGWMLPALIPALALAPLLCCAAGGPQGAPGVGERYALVFYARLTEYAARALLDGGYRVKVAILEPSTTPSPPRVFKERGVVSLGYLNILGVPSSLLDWVRREHPEWLLYTPSGEPARYWYGQSVMCNLAVESFKEYLVSRARSIVERGYDGVFLDDVHVDPAGLGGPLYDRPVYDEARYGPWVDHLVDLFRRVKSETGAVIIYNAGWAPPDERLMEVADGVMLESHPGSWRGDYRSPTYYLRDWETIYSISLAAQRYAERGKIVVALSYGGDEGTALYTYAAARLFDFYYWYSVPALDTIPESKVLKLDLGEPLGGHREEGGAYFRVHSKGVVVLNPTGARKRLSIEVPGNLSKLADVKTGRVYEAREGRLEIEVGPVEGLVLALSPAEEGGPPPLPYIAAAAAAALSAALLWGTALRRRTRKSRR